VTPAIEAAWIAAGATGFGIVSTATVAIVGFRSTRNATVRAIAASTANTMASLAAAREDRLWEKRAAAYEEIIGVLTHRQMKRQHELRMYRLPDANEQQLKDFFDSYNPPRWFESQARLLAYASDDVRQAFEATRGADLEVRVGYDRWLMLTEQVQTAMESGNFAAAPDGSLVVQARKDVNPALEEAEARDEAVIKLIRDELHSRPQSAVTALMHSAPRRRRLGHSSE